MGASVSYVKIIVIILTLLFALSGGASAQAQQANNISDLLAYIDQSWDALTRSPVDCKTVMDVRVPEHSLLYLPVDYPEPASVKELQAKCKIAVEPLPQRITSLGSLNMDNSPRQGVLYLPNPYVVPGGFLNEMYGWDSYFIMVGLLRAGRLLSAQSASLGASARCSPYRQSAYLFSRCSSYRVHSSR